MQAYVFGRHTGEPPLHLVGTTHDGVTVQAMTALEGAEHTLFTKLHVENAAVLSEPRSVDDPIGQIVDDATITLGCTSPDCDGLIGDIVSRVAFIGTGHSYFAFMLCHADGPLDHLRDYEKLVGPNRIAAATDGKGRVILELAGDDPEELAELAARITDHPAIRDARIYRSKDLVRVPQ